MERLRLDGGIGSNDRDHGSHIGHDHARALAHAAHRISVARMARSLAAIANGILLGMRIGRHDGTGRIGTAMGRERLVGGRDGCLKRVDRQNLSDHTRRGNQDLLGLAANNLRGDVARLARAG